MGLVNWRCAVTDRHAGYLVVLDHDMREDDAEKTIAALWMIRGVAAVTPLISSWEVHVAEARADRAWRDRILELLREGPDA
jgi:hypothetical protein